MLDFLPCLGGLAIATASRFGAELNPGLDGLLSLLSDGRIHFSIPWLGGLQTSCAMSTLEQRFSNYQYILKIS